MNMLLRTMLSTAAVLVALLISTANGIYEDEAGVNDWRLRFVGHVEAYDVLNSVVASDQAVAKIRKGQIEWRRTLFDGRGVALLHHEDDHVVAVSGDGHTAARVDTKGAVVWQRVLVPAGICTSPADAMYSKGLLYVCACDHVYAVTLDEGEVSDFTLPENSTCMRMFDTTGGLQVLATDHSDRLHLVGISSSGQVTPASLPQANVPSGVVSCVRASSTHAACLDESHHTHVLALFEDDIKQATFVKASQLSELHPASSVFVARAAEVAEAVRVLPDGTPTSIQNGEGQAISYLGSSLLVASNVNGDLKVASVTMDGKASVLINANIPSTAPVERVFAAVKGSGDKKKIRVVVSLVDGTLTSFVEGASTPSWTRFEDASSIVHSTLFDLPPADLDDESFSGEGSPIAHFISRIHHTIKDLLSLASIFASQSEDTLQRDMFNTRKLVVSVTSFGTVFAIDSKTSKTIWRTSLVDTPAAHSVHRAGVYTLRSAAHLPAIAIVIISLSDGSTVARPLDPLTGQLEEPLRLGKVVSAALLPEHDVHTHINPLALVTSDHKVHLYPNTPEAWKLASNMHKPLFTYVIDKSSGTVDGFKLKFGEVSGEAVPRWHVRFNPEVETIASLASPHSSDRVSSVGDIVQDKQVLYKYLNPNMIAIVTTTGYVKRSANMTLYLLDTVKGTFIHKFATNFVRHPIHVAMAENFIAIQYKNHKAKRYELSVVELFQSTGKPGEDEFTSMRSAKPTAIRQTYVLPTAVSHMAVTTTTHGVTQKQLLLGLPSGSIYALDRALYSARRPDDIEVAKELGIPPYEPVVRFMTTSFINYNQTVDQLSNIVVAPSALESTCIVFASGLDLFLTQVSPSQKFDVLDRDFDYVGLVLTLLGLAAATVGLAWVSQRRALAARWK